MRRAPLATAFCLLAALALAGCNSDPDPPTEGNTGTTPPTYQTTTPGSTATLSSSTSTTSSNASTSTYPSSSPRFGAHHQELSASSPGFPGLGVSGQLGGGGERVTVEASAFNFGERTYRVSNVCVQPWTESLSGASGPAQMRKPLPACTGSGLRDFQPGESIPYSGAWDGTVWSDGRYAAAPAGTYTWTLTFTVYSGGSGAAYDNVANLSLPFTVTVK